MRESILAAGKIKGGKLTNHSVNRIMQLVKAIFTELHADVNIETNPAARVGRLKEKRIAEIQPFEAIEVAALLKPLIRATCLSCSSCLNQGSDLMKLLDSADRTSIYLLVCYPCAAACIGQGQGSKDRAVNP